MTSQGQDYVKASCNVRLFLLLILMESKSKTDGFNLDGQPRVQCDAAPDHTTPVQDEILLTFLVHLFFPTGYRHLL